MDVKFLQCRNPGDSMDREQQGDLYAVMQLGVDGIITDFPDRLYAMR